MSSDGSSLFADRGVASLRATPAVSARLVAAAWTVIGAAAVGQRYIERALAGGANDFAAIAVDVWLIALWAVATPFILQSASRFPLRAGVALRNAAIHLGMAISFVVTSNVLIRLPLLATASGARHFGLDLATGLVRFGPMALTSYAVIVAIGYYLARTAATRSAAAAATHYAERIAVREWNREHLVRAADVAWIESDDNYVIVQVAGRVLKGRGRISELETRLDPTRFVRIHRSAIVSRERIREVRALAKGDLAVLMDDGKMLRVARTRRRALEAMLGR